MVPSDRALLRSLIAVAWADGKVAEEETALIGSLIDSFGADEAEAAEFRAFSAEQRTLEDLPLGDLDPGSRRRLLQLAVLVSYVDGVQDERELALIHGLADSLGISPEERVPLMKGSEMRARGLLRVLQA
jgi:uncharacterized tellurite resistance protein B-like protein